MSDESHDMPMSLVEHLEELRKRIVISVIAIGVGMAVCYIFRGWLLEFLTRPLGDKKLITLSPTESFMTVFEICAYSAFIITSPVLIYQLWAFVAPGLKARERRVVLIAVGFTSLLFLAGVAFSWFLVLPGGMSWLLNYEGDFFNQQVQAAKYFSFVALFLLSFGIIFELPALLLTLARLGIIDSKWMAQRRRYAAIVGALISALLTPTQDIISMLAMMIPFVLLYEMSIHLSKLIQKPSRLSRFAADAEGADAGEPAG